MYVESNVQNVVRGYNGNNGYHQRESLYKIPRYSNRNVVFVSSSDHSSVLPAHNIVNNLSHPNSGNSVKGSNLVIGATSHPAYVHHGHQAMQGGTAHGSAQRNLDPFAMNMNNRVPSLNSVAASLSQDNPVSFSQGHEMVNDRFVNLETRQMNTGMNTNHRIRMSPPREKFIEPLNHSHRKIKMIGCTPQGRPLRKRNRSEASTESTESHSSKFVKTTEDASGSCRVFESKSRRRPQSGKVKSPRSSNKRTSYNMKRLDLGPSIGNVRHQQELESRLKAMVYSNKILREDKAIVMPSLPSILSLQTP